jgi:endonuclease/exonuclease/phosphatase family metal-dependent hydrolase
MKIITLNTWGGRAGHKELFSFLEKQKQDTDVFCFQEMWSAPYSHLEGTSAGGKSISNKEIMVFGVQDFTKILNDFVPYFRPHHGDHYGLLMFVRKGQNVLTEGEFFVYKEKGDIVPEGMDVGFHPRNVQYLTLEIEDGKTRTICNFHGLWNGRGKSDSEDRLRQSEKIISFLSSMDGEIIFCGDFNLLPNTKSLLLLEDFGLRNLVKEYEITSTRTSLYTKSEKFADYILVSDSVKVCSFEVLPDEVSDHSPLSLVVK